MAATWPTYLLAAFGGGLLAALLVAGVAAHWVNTAGAVGEVSAIFHRQTVPPHRELSLACRAYEAAAKGPEGAEKARERPRRH